MLTNSPNPACGILYIDDEEKALKYFRMAFSEKYTVFTAPSGKEGLEILRREAGKIGIVLSDQRMPEMLGAEVLGAVREEFPAIVRILTTAYSDLDSAIQAVNTGHIYQYVVKPWEIPDLGMVLQRAADYYRVLSERNELLALKMTTLQRLVCSDRVKWLLLASRSWDEAGRSVLRRVLSALVRALPDSPDALIPENFRAEHFEIGALLRGEYHNGERCLDAADRARRSAGSPEAGLKAFAAGLDGQAEVSGGGADLQLHVSGPSPELFRTAFGILFERETTEPSLRFFEALFAVATADGSVTISAESSGPDASLAFRFPSQPAPSADGIIDDLAGKFAKWDISKL